MLVTSEPNRCSLECCPSTSRTVPVWKFYFFSSRNPIQRSLFVGLRSCSYSQEGQNGGRPRAPFTRMLTRKVAHSSFLRTQYSFHKTRIIRSL